MSIEGWGGAIHPAADVFPLLEGSEFDDLVASIRVNGLREACWLDRDGVLLDGRNRVRACQAAEVRPRFQQYDGDDPVSFIVDLNLERRHLNAGQKAFLALELEPFFAEQAAKRKGGRPPQEPAPGMFDEPAPEGKPVATWPPVSEKEKRGRKSREKAARKAGASGRSVSRAKKVQADAPDLAGKVKAGEIELGRAERIIRDREAERRRIEAAAAERAAAAVRPRVDIRHGDFRQVLDDLRDVDAVITDPPYPREFVPLLGDLAAWADRVLTPDGVLVILLGQSWLPDAYRLLSGGRRYRWTGCYLTPGAGYVSKNRRVQSNWKPLLVYGGGPRFADIVRSEGTDAGAKSLHGWGQDYGAFHTIVERFTSAGQTVVDPFMGAGTTLLAANALGRHAIGCDIDPDHVATATRRLA